MSVKVLASPTVTLPETVESSSAARHQIKGSPGAETDCASLIQAAYDEGARRIVLDVAPSNGAVLTVYYLNSPVFLDKTTGGGGPIDQQVVIEVASGVELVLGPNLPSTAAFIDDPTVKWAFFPGTLRSAYNKGEEKVVCSEATSATGGTQQAQPGVIFTGGGVVNGQSANTGVAFGNQCSILFGLNAKKTKFGFSWTGYVDHNGVLRCTWHSAGTAASAGTIANCHIMYQQTNGDGVYIEPVETDGPFVVWHATQCRSGKVVAGVSGAFYFKQCLGIEIDVGHMEIGSGSVANPVPVIVSNCSQITLRSSLWAAGTVAGRPFLEINDEAGATADGSIVKFDGCCPWFYTSSKDTVRSPDIEITAVLPNTRVIWEHSYPRFTISSGTHYASSTPIVKSSVTAVDKALRNANFTSFRRAALAASKWELYQRNGEWFLDAGGLLAGLESFPAQATPTGITVGPQAAGVEGTLVNGEKYEYAVAIEDDHGNRTAPSAVQIATATATGAVNIQATLSSAPVSLVVWRKKGETGNVLTEPEAFAVLPMPGVKAVAYDTGVNISGVPWLTAGPPLGSAFTNTAATPYITTPSGGRLVGGKERSFLTATNAKLLIPSWAKTWRIRCAGGGGGGGGGGTPSSGVEQAGGAGGSAGVAQEQVGEVGAATELNVKIGKGGKGGAAGAIGGHAGVEGEAGEATNVTGTGISVRGEAGGQGKGPNASTTTAALPIAFGNVQTGSTGAGIPGSGGESGKNASAASGISAAGGGGGGNATATLGGTGGKAGTALTGGAKGAKGGEASANGGKGESAAANSAAGGGGGGGGATATGTAGEGGEGGSGWAEIEFA